MFDVNAYPDGLMCQSPLQRFHCRSFRCLSFFEASKAK